MANGDSGLVLIGPGSEWLWAMVGNAVLVVTLVGLYVQVRAERASRIFEQVKSLEQEWNARAFQCTRLQALIDIEHRPTSSGMPNQANLVAGWFDRLGLLVRKGHVHQEDVVGSFAEAILSWWTLTSPYIAHDRSRFGAQTHLSDFEQLADRMRRAWEREFGQPYELQGTLGSRIDALATTIRIGLDAERGVIPRRTTPPDPDGEAA